MPYAKFPLFPKFFQSQFFLNLLIYYCSNFCSLLPQLQFLSQPPPFLLSGSISFALHYMPKSHSHMYNTCTGFFFCFPFLSSAHLFTHLMAQPIYHCSNQHNAVCTLATVTRNKATRRVYFSTQQLSNCLRLWRISPLTARFYKYILKRSNRAQTPCSFSASSLLNYF